MSTEEKEKTFSKWACKWTSQTDAKKAASNNRNWGKFTSDEIKRIEQPGSDFKTSIFSKINEVVIFLRRTENCGGKTGQNKTRLGRHEKESNRNAGNEEKLYKNVNQNKTQTGPSLREN